MFNQLVGRTGETIATTYLRRKGYKILERNFKARYGELDIICLQNDVLVFVEVKTRSDDTYGSPEDAVTPKKLREVIQTAQYYKAQHPELPDALRIDVIGIQLAGDTTTYFRHTENVTG